MTEQSNGILKSGVRNTVRAMRPRDREQIHRVSTPLELFFDLCFVVAVAQAGSELAHALMVRHFGHGIESYFIVFFAIWWAWMNFTWFASAYDTDDIPYRLATLVQIAGALVLAAGIPRAFEHQDFKTAVWGYVIMRIALVTQWVRAALGSEGPERRMALRYAAGIVVVQVWWVLWVYFVPPQERVWTFVLGAVADVMVPLLAERETQSAWHPHHISERYGLFTLIVLGETVSAATIAVQSAVDEHEALGELLPIAIGGLLICFAAWWIYFARPVAHALRENRQAFVWGYGHYVVFAAAAAIGAGLEVAVEQAVGKTHELSEREGTLAVTVPTALFLLVVWGLHVRKMGKTRAQLAVYPVTTAAVLLMPTVLWAGVVCAAAVTAGLLLDRMQRVPRLST